ncbi:MAG: hypothetical protein HY717_03530 [Planctomycetes bacterium]|nr:hypothetical protein [Planctomycetota bacterium]
MNRPLITFAVLLLPTISVADVCFPAYQEFKTDHFYFTFSSNQGAVGDVVEVDISVTLLDAKLDLEISNPILVGIFIVGCYDRSALELLDSQRYSDFYESLVFFTYFYPPGGEAGRPPWDNEGVFSLACAIRREADKKFLLPGQSFPLATVYFRILSDDKPIGQVRPCENKLVGRSCETSQLYYQLDEPPREFHTLSSLHVPGTINIVPGEPTHPDLPPLPPDAKIYSEVPTADNAKVNFELVGPLFVEPGGTNVAMDLFATSNYEFSGFMTAIRFPPEYLQLVRVEEHTRPGIKNIDNQSGGFGLLMANTRRRVGQEGERVLLATLYFNVAEGTNEKGEVDIRFERFENFYNWIAVYHRQGLNDGSIPIATEVAPLFLTKATLKIRSGPKTLRGDANFDNQLDTADAIVDLQYLFLGGLQPDCPIAADFDLSGELDITDPIILLSSVFLGEPPLNSLEPAEVPCE